MRKTPLLALLFLARAAHADSTVTMMEHFDKGQEAYEASKFELAAAEFRAAYEAKPSAQLLYNEAVCYERLNRFDQALKLYREYLSKPLQPRDRADAEKHIAAIEAHKEIAPPPKLGFVEIETTPAGATLYLGSKLETPLGPAPWSGRLTGKQKIIAVARDYKDVEKEVSLDPSHVNHVIIVMSEKPPLAWLEVTSNVPHAAVYVDDVKYGPVGFTPYHDNITPGRHTIIVGSDGFHEGTRELEGMEGGQVYKLEVALEKAPVGFIDVGGSTALGGVVKVDGKVLCRPAPCRGRVPSGAHELRVEKEGLKPYVRRIDVAPATETELLVKLAPDPGHGDAYWKFGFAGAFLAGGLVLSLEANAVHDDLQHDIDTGLPPPRPGDSRYLRGKIFSYAADGCFALGAITAVVATVSLLSDHGPPSEGAATPRDLAVSPVLGAGYAGQSAQVTW